MDGRRENFIGAASGPLTNAARALDGIQIENGRVVASSDLLATVKQIIEKPNEDLSDLIDSIIRALSQAGSNTLNQMIEAMNKEDGGVSAKTFLISELKKLGVDTDSLFKAVDIDTCLIFLANYWRKMQMSKSNGVPAYIKRVDTGVLSEADKGDFKTLALYLLDNCREEIVSRIDQFINMGGGENGAAALSLWVSRVLKDKKIDHLDYSEKILVQKVFELLASSRSRLEELLADPNNRGAGILNILDQE